jgi:hypothetical protein
MSTTLLSHGAEKPRRNDDTDASSFSGDEKGSKVSVTAVDAKVPPLGAPLDEQTGNPFTSIFKRKTKTELEAIATQPSVFDDPTSLEAYRPPPQYENTHRFNPLARWTWREENVRLLTVSLGVTGLTLPTEDRAQDGPANHGVGSHHVLLAGLG